MRGTFQDKHLQRIFSKQGYVILPLLSTGDIREMKDHYQTVKQPSPHKFHTSIWGDSARQRKIINEFLVEKLQPKLEKVLFEHRPVFSNYMVKEPGENSSIGLHQDWTFLDEKKYNAVNVWIPLVDTHPGNGPLQIIPFSHRFPNVVRGREIESPYSPFSNYILNTYAKPLEVKAGHAVLFNERLLHASPDNLGSVTRLATSIVMIPNEASIWHFFKPKNASGIIRKLVVEPAFFTDFGLFDDLEALEGEDLSYKAPRLSQRRLDLFHQWYKLLSKLS